MLRRFNPQLTHSPDGNLVGQPHEAVDDLLFRGGRNIKNGGVQIATLDRTESAWTATFGSLVTAELKAEVEALKAAIIDGSVVVADYATK